MWHCANSFSECSVRVILVESEFILPYNSAAAAVFLPLLYGFVLLMGKLRLMIGCEILRALSVGIIAFFDVTPCNLEDTKVKLSLHTS
jgi:hypothetical protein